MHYGGHYPEECIPFLKECLRTAYGKEIFVGGRGKTMSGKNGDGTYINTPKDNSFTRFSGVERIHAKNGDLLGEYRYDGHALCDMKKRVKFSDKKARPRRAFYFKMSAPSFFSDRVF